MDMDLYTLNEKKTNVHVTEYDECLTLSIM